MIAFGFPHGTLLNTDLFSFPHVRFQGGQPEEQGDPGDPALPRELQEEVDQAAEKLIQLPANSKRLIVASNEPLANLKKSLQRREANVTLTKLEQGRHLYVAIRGAVQRRVAKLTPAEQRR